MKRLLILTSLLLTSLTLSAQPQIKFERLSHNFGTLTYRSDAQTVTLPFTNTGDAPLVLLRSSVECSCITVKLPSQPVKPGKTGAITITYNPNRDLGAFHKGVEVFSNAASSRIILFVEGEVVRNGR